MVRPTNCAEISEASAAVDVTDIANATSTASHAVVKSQTPRLLMHAGLAESVLAELKQPFDQLFNLAELSSSADFESLTQQLDQTNTIIILVPTDSSENSAALNDLWLTETFTKIFAAAQFSAQQLMGQDQGGQLIFVQSVVGEVGHPQAMNSSVLAGATLGLMKSLAKEVARFKVSVNLVALGNCSALDYQLPMDQHYQKMFTMTGLGGEIALKQLLHTLDYLSGCQMAITGQILRVDGGLVI